MRVYLIRHAKAALRDPKAYPDDDDRPLTGKGRKVQKQMARALRRLDLKLDHLYSSPILRARKTAEILGKRLKLKVETAPELGHDFSVPGLLGVLQAQPDDAAIALVGHEPHLSHFAAALLSLDSDLGLHFRKSAVLGVVFENAPRLGQGALEFYLTPESALPLLEA